MWSFNAYFLKHVNENHPWKDEKTFAGCFTSSYFLNKIRLNKYRIYRYVNRLTRGNLKCPKNYVKDIFCTWWHMICICLWNVPFSFSCLKSDHAFFLEMPHFYYDRKSCNPPFSNHSKNFWFKNRGISKSDNTKKEGNWNCSFLGHFKNKCKYDHVQDISAAYFLGHFK